MENTLFKELNLDLNKKEILCFVGAGGKTTTLYKLSKEISTTSKKTLISTTTKIFKPNKNDYNNLFLGNINNRQDIASSSISIFGEEIQDGKLIGPSKNKLDALIGIGKFDFYLVEADGANRKPIKAPAHHEPVILESTTKTVGLVGLDALGERISDISHRPEILGALLGKNLSETISTGDITKLALDKSGLFKEAKGEKILLLNKANTRVRIDSAKMIRRSLYKRGFKKVVIADILTNSFY